MGIMVFGVRMRPAPAAIAILLLPAWRFWQARCTATMLPLQPVSTVMLAP